jgi:hypothetical protein
MRAWESVSNREQPLVSEEELEDIRATRRKRSGTQTNHEPLKRTTSRRRRRRRQRQRRKKESKRDDTHVDL